MDLSSKNVSTFVESKIDDCATGNKFRHNKSIYDNGGESH